jgi:hypothetical protein
MLKQMMPALLLLALLDATSPALARGLVPVCSAGGTQWVDLEGGQKQRPESESTCPHGWCAPRKPRPDRGAGSAP